MEKLTPIVNLKKEALRFGLIWAGIDVVLFLLTYYVKPDMMGSIPYAVVGFLIKIGLAIYFSLELRKAAGGFWTFKEALSAIFVMFIVSTVLMQIFSVLFAHIEPSYVSKMTEISEKSTIAMLEKMGSSQDVIDAASKELHTKLEKQFNPGFKEIFTNLGIAIITNFIGALIFGAIFKKDRPFIAPSIEE